MINGTKPYCRQTSSRCGRTRGHALLGPEFPRHLASRIVVASYSTCFQFCVLRKIKVRRPSGIRRQIAKARPVSPPTPKVYSGSRTGWSLGRVMYLDKALS